MRWAVCGIKGGSGRSTLATNLAAEGLARGLRTLLVDADPQGTARTWADVATEQGLPAPSAVAMGAGMHKPGQLDRVAAGFDLAVIDGPPRLGDVLRSILMTADVALVPCGPSASDTWAVAQSVELVLEAQALRPDLAAALVVTRKQARTAIGDAVRGALESTGLPILRTEVHYRVAFQEALAAGRGVVTYAPGTAAAREVQDLYDELEALTEGKTRGEEAPKHRPKKAARAR